MNTEIQANGNRAGKKLSRFVKRHADLALRGLRNKIDLVNVFVGKSDASLSGEEARCLVTIRLYAQREIVVESVHANLQVAIQRTLVAAGWAAALKLKHLQAELMRQQLALIGGRIARGTAGSSSRSICAV